LKRGYIQIYTGNGKGKTTAALGLALRAAGAGMNVFIGQFIKKGEYSEIKSLKRFDDRITLEQYGGRGFIKGKPNEEDRERALHGLNRLREAVTSGKYDVVILEEVNIALKFGLFPLEAVKELLKQKPEKVELVLTGRDAPQELIENADLVTEMQEIKHYASKGVKARVGIEK